MWVYWVLGAIDERVLVFTGYWVCLWVGVGVNVVLDTHVICVYWVLGTWVWVYWVMSSRG